MMRIDRQTYPNDTKSVLEFVLCTLCRSLNLKLK